MVKTLTRTGSSLVLEFDQPLLEATGIDADTPLEISTRGDVILVSPVRDRRRTKKFGNGVESTDERYAGIFRRLA